MKRSVVVPSSLQLRVRGLGLRRRTVRKGGLPPLFLIQLLYRKSGGKPPFLTCEFMIIESCTVRCSLTALRGGKAATKQI